MERRRFRRVVVAILVAIAGWTMSCGEPPQQVVEHSEPIESDQTWSGPHLITDNLKIRATVTIEPGAEVRVGGEYPIVVENGGAIVARGTADEPVTFTSGQSSPTPGDWQSIDIYSSASGNTSFEHTVVEYGGSRSDDGLIWVEGGERASLSNVTFRHSAAGGVWFASESTVAGFENVSFENLAEPAVRVPPSQVPNLSSVETTGDVPPVAILEGRVTESQSWANLDHPYLMTGKVRFRGEVEVEAGTQLRMGAGVVHPVEDGGAIRLMGSSDQKVNVRSHRSSPAPGDWGGFEIYSSAAGTNLARHADIRHGGSAGNGAFWVQDGTTLTLENVDFSDNQDCDVADNGTVETTNTEYASCSQ